MLIQVIFSYLDVTIKEFLAAGSQELLLIHILIMLLSFLGLGIQSKTYTSWKLLETVESE